jgi:hypothetical protein
VVDSTGWASDSQELIVVDAGGSGFTFALAPNCDPATDPFCQPGAGHVGPPTPVVAEAAGVVELVYPPTEVEAGLAQPPSGTAVRPVDLGTLGDLVACSGVPAFDPALLPAGVGHEEAQRAVQVCTGISTWHGRSRPGVETAVTGQARRSGGRGHLRAWRRRGLARHQRHQLPLTGRPHAGQRHSGRCSGRPALYRPGGDRSASLVMPPVPPLGNAPGDACGHSPPLASTAPLPATPAVTRRGRL